MTLKLFPQQLQHLEKLVELTDRYPIAMDLSFLGTGKTYTSSALAMHLATHKDMCQAGIIVIANTSVVSKWNTMKTLHGVPLLHVLSYASLRSRKGVSKPAHNLLTRRDWYEVQTLQNGNERVIHRVSFDATEYYNKLVERGILLVFDEIQNIKNHGTDQQKAACALLHQISVNKNKSRALLMSGSPIDKEVHALSMVQALCLLGGHTSLAAYDIGMREHDLSGMYHVLQKCRQLPGYKKAVQSHAGLANAIARARCSRTCHDATYHLFQKVIKPAMSAAMVSDQTSVASQNMLQKMNGMFKLDDKVTLDALQAAIDGLAKAARFNDQNNTVGDMDAHSLGAIVLALGRIENIKADTFYRLALKELNANPTSKVVICLNYNNSITRIQALLERYNPLVMTGACSSKERQVIIDTFQKPDSQCRVLVGNLSVMSTGIDLDDKHGGWPRTCFVSPMYSTIALYQLGHRFKRLDTHPGAIARLYMVYIEGMREDRIIHALQRKGAIMKETVQEQADAGVVFPCDYPEYVET